MNISDFGHPSFTVSLQTGLGNVTAGCVTCQCNMTGSQSNTCNPVTGHCYCKVGVGGALCDRCADGHYAYSTDGCKGGQTMYSSIVIARQICQKNYKICDLQNSFILQEKIKLDFMNGQMIYDEWKDSKWAVNSPIYS